MAKKAHKPKATPVAAEPEIWCAMPLINGSLDFDDPLPFGDSEDEVLKSAVSFFRTDTKFRVFRLIAGSDYSLISAVKRSEA